ncbi:hypothetical protein HKB23_02520, partial [Vibrio parahaemolyticus]|nr:hypothetical protein [Vibrio parahaemolyticus]
VSLVGETPEDDEYQGDSSIGQLDNPGSNPLEFSAATQPVEGKSVIDLVDKCLAYLDKNVDIQEEDPIDIEGVRSGVRRILSHSNLPSNF